MKWFAVFHNSLLLMLFASLVSSCAENLPYQKNNLTDKEGVPVTVESEGEIKNAPVWVKTGSILDNQDGKRLFLGVSFSSPMGDMALQKSVADDKARLEISQLLTSYLNKVLTDFIRLNLSKDPFVKDTGFPVSFENTIQSSMAEARIIKGGWRGADTNNVWSIAELDMKYVKKAVAADSNLSDEFKGFVETVGDDFFDSISGLPGNENLNPPAKQEIKN